MIWFVSGQNQGVTKMILVIFLLYVNDMLITGTSSILLDQFLYKLKDEFVVKDLGRVLYFLGIQIESINSGLLLSQAQYATKILQKVGILDCKPISTTTVSKLQVLESSPPYHDLIEYKELVRSLQYLTFTRPDIAYSINCACQHMHAPTQFHFDQVKCIL